MPLWGEWVNRVAYPHGRHCSAVKRENTTTETQKAGSESSHQQENADAQDNVECDSTHRKV